MAFPMGNRVFRGFVAALAVVGCAYMGIHLLQRKEALVNTGSKGAVGIDSNPSQNSADSGPDGLNTVQQSLQRVLDSIPGLQEVALGNDDGGEELTATINMPYGSEASKTSGVVASLMQEYLADAFNADASLESAQLYFVSDGQIVAGGSLNRSAYEAWTVGASANASGASLLSWMASLPESVNAGKPSGWFETAAPVSTGSP